MCEGCVEGSGDGIISRGIGYVCKLKGVQGGGRLDMRHDQLPKALLENGSELDQTAVIEAGGCQLLRDQNDGGSFEVCGDHREMLKMTVKTFVSSSVQSLSTKNT